MEVITDFNSLSYFPVLKLNGIQKAQVYLHKEQYESLKDLLLQVKTVCVLGSIESDIPLLKELFKQSIYLKQVLSFDNKPEYFESLFKELKTKNELSLHYYENLQQLLEVHNWV